MPRRRTAGRCSSTARRSTAGAATSRRTPSAHAGRSRSGLLTVDPGDGKDTRGALDIITADTYDRFDSDLGMARLRGRQQRPEVLHPRGHGLGDRPRVPGCIDDERHADAKIGPHRQTSALYDVLAAPQPRPIKPAGEWNTSRVRVAPSRVVPGGTRVYHYLNDVRVLEYELDSPELRAAIAKSKFKDVARFGKLQNGHILLQDHGDRVWYRNVKIQRTAATVATVERPAAGEVVANEAARRVDVTHRRQAVHLVHLSRHAQKKPVLYPDPHREGHARDARLPARCRAPGERVDHPHHVGLWFNHGDVNGLDFWNNRTAFRPRGRRRWGRSVTSASSTRKSGADRRRARGRDGMARPDGVALLRERPLRVPRLRRRTARIDRITTLTALDNAGRRSATTRKARSGLRVARALEQPADKPELFTDANGKPKKTPVLDNTGVTGQYLSSEGLKGDAVWGTRGRWCILTGNDRRRAGDARDPRSPVEPERADLLARARLRPVRRQRRSAARCSTRRSGGARADARAWQVGHVSPPGPGAGRHGNAPTRSSASTRRSRRRRTSSK